MNPADKTAMIMRGMANGDIGYGQTITTDNTVLGPPCHMNPSYFDPSLMDIWWPRFELFLMGAVSLIIVFIVLMVLGKTIEIWRQAVEPYEDDTRNL